MGKTRGGDRAGRIAVRVEVRVRCQTETAERMWLWICGDESTPGLSVRCPIGFDCGNVS